MANIMKSNDNEPYVAVPFWFIRLTSGNKNPMKLTAFKRELFWMIKGLSKDQPCYANDKYFAKIYNVSIRHINTTLSELSSLEFIYIEHKNNKRLITVNESIDKGCSFFYFDNDKVIIYSECDKIITTRKDFENDTIDFFKRCS